MMFYYFGKMNVQDLVIVEVGLGGRLDSTNVIYPLLSVITNIGYDHMNILGETLEAIAFEKAGIIKAGVPVITAVEQPEALRVIKEKAASVKAKAYILGDDFIAADYAPLETGEQFSLETPFARYQSLTTAMFGAHQVKNAALAVMAADYLRTYYSFIIETEHIRDGVAKAKWIGRFEQICDKPMMIIDGAHNEAGVQSLIETVQTHFADKDVHILVAALTDKPLDKMIQPLADIAQTITFASFDFPRAATAQQLAELCDHPRKTCVDHWQHWLIEKKERYGERDLFLITGSLYFISDVRKFLKNSYMRQRNC
jgi:dihydrofolate synthase/folylpolyglutamate synthase